MSDARSTLSLQTRGPSGQWSDDDGDVRESALDGRTAGRPLLAERRTDRQVMVLGVQIVPAVATDRHAAETR